MQYKWRLADYGSHESRPLDENEKNEVLVEDRIGKNENEENVIFVEDEIYKDENENIMFTSDYLIQSFYIRQRRKIDEETSVFTLQELEKLTTGIESAVAFLKDVQQHRVKLNINGNFENQLAEILKIVIDTIKQNKELDGREGLNGREVGDRSRFNDIFEELFYYEAVEVRSRAITRQIESLHTTFNNYVNVLEGLRDNNSIPKKELENRLLEYVKDIPRLLGEPYENRLSYYYLTQAVIKERLCGGIYNYLSVSLLDSEKFTNYVERSWNQIYNMVKSFMDNYVCSSNSATIPIDFVGDIDRLNNISNGKYKKTSRRCVGLVLVDQGSNHKEYVAFSGLKDTDNPVIVKKVIAPKNSSSELSKKINDCRNIIRTLQAIVDNGFSHCIWARLTEKVGDYDYAGVLLNTLANEIASDPDQNPPKARYSCCERKCFVNVKNDWSDIDSIKIYARFSTCSSCHGGIEELKQIYGLSDGDVVVIENK